MYVHLAKCFNFFCHVWVHVTDLSIKWKLWTFSPEKYTHTENFGYSFGNFPDLPMGPKVKTCALHSIFLRAEILSYSCFSSTYLSKRAVIKYLGVRLIHYSHFLMLCFKIYFWNRKGKFHLSSFCFVESAL